MKIKIDPEKLNQMKKAALIKNKMLGKVLIVDDEPANLYALEKVLSHYFEVLPFSDPNEALQHIMKEKFDIIISDQRMPIMLGTEFLARSIKINNNNIRMILTAHTDSKDLITCINEGLIYRYITKPWDPEEILAIAKEALKVISHRRVLDQLIPSQIVSRLCPDGLQEVHVGEGITLECACLFLDVRGFTALSDKLSLADSFEILKEFLAVISPYVDQNYGFIDKYLGDGVLAVFDKPSSYALDAVNYAVTMLKIMEKEILIDGSLIEKMIKLNFGIGINTGEVILGTVGFSGRIEFTVLGDVVNTASRIEALTKIFNVPLLIHENAIKLLPKDKIVYRRKIGDILVKGKNQPLPIWEIFEHESDEAKQKKASLDPIFQEAINSYQHGEVEKAVSLFEKILHENPQDQVVKLYLTPGPLQMRDLDSL